MIRSKYASVYDGRFQLRLFDIDRGCEFHQEVNAWIGSSTSLHFVTKVRIALKSKSNPVTYPTLQSQIPQYALRGIVTGRAGYAATRVSSCAAKIQTVDWRAVLRPSG